MGAVLASGIPPKAISKGNRNKSTAINSSDSSITTRGISSSLTRRSPLVARGSGSSNRAMPFSEPKCSLVNPKQSWKPRRHSPRRSGEVASTSIRNFSPYTAFSTEIAADVTKIFCKRVPIVRIAPRPDCSKNHLATRSLWTCSKVRRNFQAGP